MTTKERLHELVDDLREDQADKLLRLATELVAVPTKQGLAEPSWVGALHSGRGDLSERHEEILKGELGRAV